MLEKLKITLSGSHGSIDCFTPTYVGSTVRAAYMRFAEHEGISFCTGKKLSHPKQSSIRDHTARCGSFDQRNFQIIGHEKSEVFLRILESLHILKEKPELNDTQSAFPLCIVK